MASRSPGQPARLEVGALAATPDQSPPRSVFTRSFDSHYVRGGPEGWVRVGGEGTHAVWGRDPRGSGRGTRAEPERRESGVALAIPAGQAANPHPATPPTSALDQLLILGREQPDHPVFEWAGRRVDFRLTEKRHGVEVGLSSLVRDGTGARMESGALPAEALMVLLAAVCEGTGCGRPGRAAGPGCLWWIADPGLFRVDISAEQLASSTAWADWKNSVAGTRALIPVNISNTHWLLLEADPHTRVCYMLDSLPGWTRRQGQGRDLPARAIEMLGRLWQSGPWEVRELAVTEQAAFFNDCAVFTGCNALHRILGTGNSASQPEVTTTRLQWIPAFILSGWKRRVSLRDYQSIQAYPWSLEDTYAAFLAWSKDQAGYWVPRIPLLQGFSDAEEVARLLGWREEEDDSFTLPHELHDGSPTAAMSDTGSGGSLLEELGLQLVGDPPAFAGGQLLSNEGVEPGGGGVLAMRAILKMGHG